MEEEWHEVESKKRRRKGQENKTNKTNSVPKFSHEPASFQFLSRKRKGGSGDSKKENEESLIDICLKISDIQNMVMWIMGGGLIPQWIVFKNLPSIKRVVYLYVDYLDEETLLKYRSQLPSLEQFQGPIKFSLPGDRRGISSTIDAFIATKETKGNKKRRLMKEAQHGQNKKGANEKIEENVTHNALVVCQEALSLSEETLTAEQGSVEVAAKVESVEILAIEEQLNVYTPKQHQNSLFSAKWNEIMDLRAEISELIQHNFVLPPHMLSVACNDDISDEISEQKQQQMISNSQPLESSSISSPSLYNFIRQLKSEKEKDLQPGNNTDNKNVDSTKPTERDSLAVPEFVATLPDEGKPKHRLVALDCEMCMTSLGLELARISILDENKKVLLNTLVRPVGSIIDYLTQWSGITEQMMEEVTTTFIEARKEIMEIITLSTIVVGHSLENDLKAMRMYHFNIIDTTIVFPHPRGPPMRKKLKFIVSEILNLEIQVGSHDSIEDSRVCIDLLTARLNNANLGKVDKNMVPIFDQIENFSKKSTIFVTGTKNCLNKYANSNSGLSVISCSDDQDVAAKLAKAIGSPEGENTANSADFVMAGIHCLRDAMFQRACDSPSEPSLSRQQELEALQKLDHMVQKITQSANPNTVICISTGHANVNKICDLQQKRRSRNFTENEEKELLKEVEERRKGIFYITIKQPNKPIESM